MTNAVLDGDGETAHRCRHCGHHVTERYAAVFSTRGDGDVECCPHCDDRTRGKDGRPRPDLTVTSAADPDASAEVSES